MDIDDYNAEVDARGNNANTVVSIQQPSAASNAADGAAVVETGAAHTVPYIFTPGERSGSRLLYATSEKQLYRRQAIRNTYDRYICISTRTGCKVALKLVKPGMLAERTDQTTKHNHGLMEDKFHMDRFEDNLKKAVKESCGLTETNNLYSEHLAKYVNLKSNLIV